MPLPTEPIGSIPRPAELLAAMNARARGEISRGQLLAAEQAALRDTIALFDRAGSPVSGINIWSVPKQRFQFGRPHGSNIEVRVARRSTLAMIGGVQAIKGDKAPGRRSAGHR